MERTVKFVFDKETKGTVRYAEVADDGGSQVPGLAVIGTLYIRKSALGGTARPDVLEVTVRSA